LGVGRPIKGGPISGQWRVIPGFPLGKGGLIPSTRGRPGHYGVNPAGRYSPPSIGKGGIGPRGSIRAWPFFFPWAFPWVGQTFRIGRTGTFSKETRGIGGIRETTLEGTPSIIPGKVRARMGRELLRVRKSPDDRAWQGIKTPRLILHEETTGSVDPLSWRRIIPKDRLKGSNGAPRNSGNHPRGYTMGFLDSRGKLGSLEITRVGG